MPSYFISGANRGIGFAMVEALLEHHTNIVVAGVRDPSRTRIQALNSLRVRHPDRLSIVVFDLSDPAKIEKAAELASAFLPNGLDFLINNAGVNHHPLAPIANIDLDLLEENIRLNAIYPIRVVRAFLPLIRRSNEKKVVYISSLLGSVDWASDWGDLSVAYSMSKTALNMMARKWSTTLKTEGITTIILHPGWVATGLGFAIEAWVTSHYPHLQMISKEESARGCLKVMRDVKPGDEMFFWTYEGGQLEW